MMSLWQRPHVCFATRRSPGFMNRMNSGDSWFNQTFEFGGFADVLQNSGCRGRMWACSFVRPRRGFPPWQSVQPRTTFAEFLCIGSTPAWHWRQPELLESTAHCDLLVQFCRGRAEDAVTV